MKLPIMSARKVIKILKKHGFEKAGQKGSHMKFKKHDGNHVRTVFVPNYSLIHKMVMLSIIRQSGMTKEEFFKK